MLVVRPSSFLVSGALEANRVKKIEKMLANQDIFGKEPDTYKEAVKNQSNISFHPQTDESALVFVGDQMKKIEPTKWKEMKKTFKHYINNPLEYDFDEVEEMVRRSAASGNSKGRSKEEAC